ncbi:MAG: 5-formyltetrahydrofolate cyclo-ligase [Campylobacterales bacterium]
MDKIEFRQKCKKKLQKVKNNYIRDVKVNQNLQTLLKALKPKSILFYYPFAFEADIRKTIKALRRQGVEIYLPLMRDVSFKVVKYRLPLCKNRFGIVEPKDSYYRFAAIEVAVIPIIGVDRNFKRVGFGKGMYDRYFDNKNSSITKIFVQRSLCISSFELCQDHDVRADFLITPSLRLKIRRDGHGIRVDSSSNCFSTIRRRSRISYIKKASIC